MAIWNGPSTLARHLLRVRALQERTGGFTEFVPLPFVHMEAPIYLKGFARRGPTFRESILMHAIARIVLHPVIRNIQVSWVKMGQEGIQACLNAGVNDLGGTLMNESISRAAGTVHGQECDPLEMERIIKNAGRRAVQRTTLYNDVSSERATAAYNAGAPGGNCLRSNIMTDTKSVIAVIGGTGNQGSGLAMRWAKAGHDIIIGSRDAVRATQVATEITAMAPAASEWGNVRGADNLSAASEGEIARAGGSLFKPDRHYHPDCRSP